MRAALLALATLAFAVVWLVTKVSAGEPIMCKAYAREQVRIGYLHNMLVASNPDATEEERARAKVIADPTRLMWRLDRSYHTCLNLETDGVLPKTSYASDEAWLEYIKEHTAAVTSSTPTVEEEKRAAPKKELTKREKWCLAHFRSYRVDDGSVIKRGARKRSPCPFPG